MKITRLLLIMPVLWAASAQARVFNFNESKFGVYLRGSGGTSGVGDDAFGDSSGTDTVLDDESKYQYSGEVGVVMGLGESFNLRIGAEIQKHHPVEGHGKNPSGVDRFEYESSVFGFNPNITAEIFMEKGEATRYFAQFGVGYTMLDVENRYTMNGPAAGEVAVGSFNEKMSGTAMSYMVGAGLETRMVDNVTLALEAGYRYSKVSELKYKGDVNNIVSPSGAAKDSAALNHDGSKRTLDLSGVFVGASLRFYLHFL